MPIWHTLLSSRALLFTPLQSLRKTSYYYYYYAIEDMDICAFKINILNAQELFYRP